jgi:ubiquinone/menaquinone biosynthesis C-methylase UbiE
MPSWTQRVTRAPVNFAIRSMYAIYLRSFGGTQDAIVVTERIIEYPFALSRLRGLPAGSKVVVVGCYGDMLTTLLPSIGLEVVGIDIKEFPLHYENFSFKQSDLRRIDLPDASFDAAAAISTIEHVGLFDADPNGDRKAVAELRRLLKPGGQLIITVPFSATAHVIPMNQRIYDRESLQRLLEGFRVQTLDAYAYTPERAWEPVALEGVPAAARWQETHCTALAVATSTV